MGGPRNEIACWGESASFRATDCRWKKIGIPGRDQYYGIAPPDGAGPASRGRRRYRPGDSTHPESETADRSARRLEFAKTRDSSAARAAETGEGGRLPGSRP